MDYNQIYKKLLTGCTIRIRSNRRRSYTHCLYDGANPVAAITRKAFDRLNPIMKCRKGNYTLNLNEVRKLNGHHNAKKFYKQSKSKENGIRSNQSGETVQVQKGRQGSDPS